MFRNHDDLGRKGKPHRGQGAALAHPARFGALRGSSADRSTGLRAAGRATVQRAARTNGAAIDVERLVWAVPLCLLAAAVWSYWPTLVELFALWQSNDDFSTGQLVPLAAIFLLWRDRQALRRLPIRASWWGLVLLLASQAVRFAGIWYAYDSAERLSFLMAASGGLLFVGGPALWRRLLWLQAFLLLMFPLPARLYEAVNGPLQGWATRLAIAGLDLFGLWSTQAGNVIQLDGQTNVMVGEACSGLRMLNAFIFIGAVVSAWSTAPLWGKLFVLLSTVPIAVITNGLRVLATCVCIHYTQDRTFEERFHDLAGFLMMPVAILLLVGELRVIDWLARDGQSPAGDKSEGTRPARRSANGPGVPPDRRGGRAPANGSAAEKTSAATGIWGLRWTVGISACLLVLTGWGHRALSGEIDAALRRVTPPARPLTELPMQVEGWDGTDVPLDARVFLAANFDDVCLSRMYFQRGSAVPAHLFIGYIGRPRAVLGHRPDRCFESQGWKPLGEELVTVTSAAGRPMEATIYEYQKEDGSGGPRLVLGLYVVNGRIVRDRAELQRYNARSPDIDGKKPSFSARLLISLNSTGDRAADVAALQDLTARIAEPALALLPYVTD